MAVRKARAKGKRPEKHKVHHEITLSNPVSQHFNAFILGNALKWEAMAHDELIRVAPEAAESLEPFEGFLGYWKAKLEMDALPAGHPDRPGLALYIDSEYKRWYAFRGLVDSLCAERFVAEEGSAKGQTLALCGAGPSLREHAAEYCPTADQVWGCNSAVTYLADHGHRVTHGFSVDQTPHMLEEWESAPDVEYLLATTCHPHLTEYLLDKGRKIRWFMNYVGLNLGTTVDLGTETMGYEDWMYSVLFPGTIRCGSGLNSVNRALDLATFMGFDKIHILGADCALKVSAPPPDAPIGSPERTEWLKSCIMHADGGHALTSDATPMTLHGYIDDRLWVTKPDMAISAVWLAKYAQRDPRINLVGDTLPAALLDKPDDFLKQLPTMVNTSTGEPLPIGVI